MSNKTYDVLKWIAQILLPTLGTLYFGLSGYWDFPKVEEVVGSITAIDLALGALLGISASQYTKSGRRYDGIANVPADDPQFAGKKELIMEIRHVPVHDPANDDPVPEMHERKKRQ